MRVIAGLFKGRILERIETQSIRPTSDRVKEAMFSILGDKVINCSFLDLFAGSGSVGIEAYSRGAAEVVFIDSNKDSIKVLRNNLVKIGLKEGIEVYNTDYSNAISKLASRRKIFDIIFLDPPYKQNISFDAIKKIFKNNILSSYGIIIIEQNVKEFTNEEIYTYKLIKKKIYGNTQLSFYVFNEVDREE